MFDEIVYSYTFIYTLFENKKTAKDTTKDEMTSYYLNVHMKVLRGERMFS